MKPRLFLTGGSGCVGHYLIEELAADYELYLLLRNPGKLMIDAEALGARIVRGDMDRIGEHAELLKDMDYCVLAATAWGVEGTERINVARTHELLGLLDPGRVKRVVYFSTASILGRDMKPLRQAEEYGTEYVRSKYRCFASLPESPVYDRIVTVFPTMVFGGDHTHPLSHVSAGIPTVRRYKGLLGRLDVDARFHFIHARDIASMVGWILRAEAPKPIYVLGNEALSLGGFLRGMTEAMGARSGWRVRLGVPQLYRLAKLLRAQMSEWDAFCAEYKDFVYDATGCGTLGLPTERSTPAELAVDADVIQAVLDGRKSSYNEQVKQNP